MLMLPDEHAHASTLKVGLCTCLLKLSKLINKNSQAP